MRRGRVLYLLVGVVALAVVGVVAIGWQLSRPVQATVGVPPAELHAEPVAFQSDSGSLIHGWFSSAPLRRGAVLLLPPVRANRLAMVSRAKFLLEAGYSTLLIDLQATGESRGDAITFGWRERLDVLAAVRFLNQRLPGAPIAILGASLGGAAALLATRHSTSRRSSSRPYIHLWTSRSRTGFGYASARQAPPLLRS